MGDTCSCHRNEADVDVIVKTGRCLDDQVGTPRGSLPGPGDGDDLHYETALGVPGWSPGSDVHGRMLAPMSPRAASLQDLTEALGRLPQVKLRFARRSSQWHEEQYEAVFDTRGRKLGVEIDSATLTIKSIDDGLVDDHNRNLQWNGGQFEKVVRIGDRILASDGKTVTSLEDMVRVVQLQAHAAEGELNDEGNEFFQARARSRLHFKSPHGPFLEERSNKFSGRPVMCVPEQCLN